jgi:hypothetical protein
MTLVPLTEAIVLSSDYDNHDADPPENNKLRRTYVFLVYFRLAMKN